MSPPIRVQPAEAVVLTVCCLQRGQMTVAALLETAAARCVPQVDDEVAFVKGAVRSLAHRGVVTIRDDTAVHLVSPR